MSAERPFLKKDFNDVVQSLISGLKEAREGGRSVLTDTTEGSVVRTLVEAFARELVVSYEQLERVYKLGYLETSEGVGLDNVVALLSVKRRPPGRVEGSVTFSRALTAPDDISIPTGTLVAGPEAPLFETVEEATLLQGNTQVTVNVRSLEPDEEVVEAASLSIMPRPILGIEAVTNLTDLFPRQREETDDELRERAQRSMHRANVGTVASLQQAVASLGYTDVRVQERIPEVPGEVDVIVGDPRAWDEEGMQRIRESIEQVRPAGIKVNLQGVTRISVDVTAILELDRDRLEHERNAVESAIRAELADYFEEIGVNENVRLAKVRNILTNNDAVMDVRQVEDLNHLEPWIQQEGERKNEAATHLLSNGDVFVGSTERAQLGVITITLEPPALDLWVDVDLELDQGQSAAGVEDTVKSSLDQFFLDVSADEPIEYGALAEVLERQLQFSSLTFTMIHDRDGRVVELRDSNDEDVFGPREELQVRYVTWRGGQS